MLYVAFKSKTEVFEFAERCYYAGLWGKVVSTPKEIKLGCGYSVAVRDGCFSKVKALLSSGDYPAFHGVFRIKKEERKTVLSRLLYPPFFSFTANLFFVTKMRDMPFNRPIARLFKLRL